MRKQLVSAIILALCSASHLTASGTRQQNVEDRLREKGLQVDTDSLLRYLQTHEDEGVRALTATLLGDRGEMRAIPLLKRLINTDEAAWVRVDSALALLTLKAESAVEIAQKMMHDVADPEQRLRLVNDLARAGDASGYELVVRSLSSDQPYVQSKAVQVLILFAKDSRFAGLKPDPYELLLDSVDGGTSRVRTSFLLLFATLWSERKDPRLIELVEKIATSDADPKVRELAGNTREWLKDIGAPSAKPQP